MKHKLTIVFSLLLLFATMSFSQVVNLTNPGAGPYATIQLAIDNAATVNGDIISVSAGSYPHGVNVTKSLTFRGANFGVAGNAVRGAESIIDGTDAVMDMGFIIALPSLTVTIDGFTFTDCSPAHDDYSPGVDGTTDWTTNVTFTNNIVSSANALQCGNVLTYWGTVTVTNNWFTHIDTEVNSSAVVLALCQNSIVSSNVFDNINYSAISLSDNQTATVNGNNINITSVQ
ncbi:MAG: hypothetical protein Q8S39_13570, partial [Ignavibacteria bacterium]|nr:hypothetical protein [Ignavibacteria bacterium]